MQDVLSFSCRPFGWEGRRRTWGRISSGELGRTATPPTWLKATAPRFQEMGCARRNGSSWGNTALRRTKHSVKWVSEGDSLPQLVQLNSAARPKPGWGHPSKPSNTAVWWQSKWQVSDHNMENHGWETPPVSLLHSHQMRCRYYTSSLPSVGFACTCYNLIRRKLDFLC